MRQLDVSVLVLEDKCPGALQHAGTAAGEPRRVTSAENRFAAGLDTDQAHPSVVDEGVENTDGVAAAADTRNDGVRQPADKLQNLCASFASDDRLKLTNHQRVRMRSEHRAEEIVRIADIGHPIAHRLVD